MSKEGGKHLINDPQECVDECLQGLVAVNPGLQILEGHKVIIRRDIDDVKKTGKVAIVCGGGSGHEPAHAAYVGPGMLSAAVCGAVFTSPAPASILAALQAVSNPAGVLLVVTNYTGDRLNFGMALERVKQIGWCGVEMVLVGEDCALESVDKTAGRRGLCGTIMVNKIFSAGTLLVVKNYTGDRLNFGLSAERAKALGLRAEMVVVGEDCALTSRDKTAGRRGLCGTVLVNKIAGALAENGKSLDEIVEICQNAAKNMGTIGLSLSPCSIPGQAASFQLGADEMELGLGIHGEAGVKRVKMSPVKAAVDTMLSHMTNPDSSTHLRIVSGGSVALMVNNLGGTSVLEMNIVAKEAIQWLETRGLSVERAYCGSFMTSLEMAGVSLTVLYTDATINWALDQPTSVPGWVKPLGITGMSNRKTPPLRPCAEAPGHAGPGQKGTSDAPCVEEATSRIIHQAVSVACHALSNHEQQLNALDREGGDGDCGSTLKRGADAVLLALGQKGKLPTSCPHHFLLTLSQIAESSMGGSSGALYSLFLTASAGPLVEDTSVVGWAEALSAGVKAVMRYGGAEPGDRTMLDALDAASKTLTSSVTSETPINACSAAVQSAEAAAKQTAMMQARAGRASYVSRDLLTQPDPGAHAVGIWLRAAFEGSKTAM